MLRTVALLAAALSAAPAAATIISVEAITSDLDFMIHAWAVVNLQLAPSYTCDTADAAAALADADAAGALVVSWGALVCAATGCDLAAKAADMMASGGGPKGGGRHTSRFFVEQNVGYAVCGMSWYSDVYGPRGSVRFAMEGSADALIDFTSATLADRGETPQCAKGNQQCTFGIGTIDVSGVDCSAVTYTLVDSELTYCASLNRRECSTIDDGE